MTLHLAAVHAAAMLPLVCCGFAHVAARRNDDIASRIGKRLAWSSLGLLALGTAIGAAMLALLWLAQQHDIFTAAQRLPPYKLAYAAGEIAFFVGCMALYVAFWNRAVALGGWPSLGHHLLAVMAATNLIYHFPPLFLALRQLASAAAPVSQPEFRALIFGPRVLSMWTHHTLAGLAAAGVWTMWFACKRGHGSGVRDQQDVDTTRGVAWGARIALVATLSQIPVGLWVLVALPQRDALLGADSIATGFLAAGIVLAVALLHHLGAAAIGETEPRTVSRSVALLLAVMLLMNAANHRARANGSGVFFRPPPDDQPIQTLGRRSEKSSRPRNV
jgi:hypothetical protein